MQPPAKKFKSQAALVEGGAFSRDSSFATFIEVESSFPVLEHNITSSRRLTPLQKDSTLTRAGEESKLSGDQVQQRDSSSSVGTGKTSMVHGDVKKFEQITANYINIAVGTAVDIVLENWSEIINLVLFGCCMAAVIFTLMLCFKQSKYMCEAFGRQVFCVNLSSVQPPDRCGLYEGETDNGMHVL